jgi:hypothetical protein
MSMTSDEDQDKLTGAMEAMTDVFLAMKGGLAETRSRMVMLGLDVKALETGEFNLISGLAGTITGTLVDYGATPATACTAMLQEALISPAVESMPPRMQQTIRASHQVVRSTFDRMCRPGTSDAVLLFLLEVCMESMRQFAPVPPAS